MSDGVYQMCHTPRLYIGYTISVSLRGSLTHSHTHRQHPPVARRSSAHIQTRQWCSSISDREACPGRTSK